MFRFPFVRLLITVPNLESYPDLQSSESFVNLQRNLTEIESQISASRRSYNAAIMEYHNGLEKFPSNLIANTFGFERTDNYCLNLI